MNIQNNVPNNKKSPFKRKHVQIAISAVLITSLLVLSFLIMPDSRNRLMGTLDGETASGSSGNASAPSPAQTDSPPQPNNQAGADPNAQPAAWDPPPQPNNQAGADPNAQPAAWDSPPQPNNQAGSDPNAQPATWDSPPQPNNQAGADPNAQPAAWDSQGQLDDQSNDQIVFQIGGQTLMQDIVRGFGFEEGIPAAVGNTITVYPKVYTSQATYSWYSTSKPVYDLNDMLGSPLAYGNSYVPTPADIGKYLIVFADGEAEGNETYIITDEPVRDEPIQSGSP